MDVLNKDGSVIEDQGLNKVEDVATVLSGQASDEQVATWKAKYPNGVWAITIVDKVAYFRKPTRDELKSVATIAQTDPIGHSETLMTDTFLGGDKAILDDDEYFFGAFFKYQNLISIRTGDLKKL